MSLTESLTHEYRPVGSAVELFGCRDPEVLLSGAAGTGKSRACLEKLHAMMMLTSGARGLIVRKTAASLGSTALVTFREKVAREALESGEVRFYGGSGERAACYRYANGSEIVVGGIDKASRIMSSEYDVIYVQEATELTEEDWESLTTRLRNGRISFQQIMADCNPGAPHHWLKQRADAERLRLVYCRHEDNPALYDAGDWTPEGRVYLDRLDALSGVRRQRLRFGLWAAAEGLVYEFDPMVHLHKAIGHPPDTWTRYMAIDFGYRNPFTCLWIAVDPEGRMYVYREVYMSGRIVEDHATTIKKHMRTAHGPEPLPMAIICDHDAEDRATLERKLGLSTVAATKNVSEGIQAVQERLKVRDDGKPGLYICRDALVERDPALAEAHKPMQLLDEILEYQWDGRSAPGQGNIREHPLKVNDHAVDALRYAVAYLDLVGRPRARFF